MLGIEFIIDVDSGIFNLVPNALSYDFALDSDRSHTFLTFYMYNLFVPCIERVNYNWTIILKGTILQYSILYIIADAANRHKTSASEGSSKNHNAGKETEWTNRFVKKTFLPASQHFFELPLCHAKLLPF